MTLPQSDFEIVYTVKPTAVNTYLVRLMALPVKPADFDYLSAPLDPFFERVFNVTTVRDSVKDLTSTCITQSYNFDLISCLREFFNETQVSSAIRIYKESMADPSIYRKLNHKNADYGLIVHIAPGFKRDIRYTGEMRI